MAGDSTMAPGGGNNGTEGWGQYLQYSFGTNSSGTIRAQINNSAIAGRSARSFTREGRFDAIAAQLKQGDWVIVEFGHNDGSSPYPASSDNGRADCPGAGNETCPTVYEYATCQTPKDSTSNQSSLFLDYLSLTSHSNSSNATEIVLTYPTYLINASKMFLAKGAKVILSSPTPDNPWETGNYTYAPDRFSYYAA